jgi:uncharacterized protein YcfL
MTRLYAIPLLAALAVSGCAATKYERDGYAFGCPMGVEKKIASKEALVKAKLEESGDVPYIDVTDIRCAERGQSLRIEADLENDGSESHRVAYRFRWLDKDGMAAAEEETWKPVMVYGKTRQTIATTSPTPDAVDFRLMMRSLDKQ